MNSKYSNLLTILLVVIIIAIVAIIAFLGYKFYETYITKSEAEEFVETTWGDSVENNDDVNYTPDSNTNNNDGTTTDEDIMGSGYSWDNTLFKENTPLVITENGTYTGYVKDKAGNIGSCSITVTTIN